MTTQAQSRDSQPAPAAPDPARATDGSSSGPGRVEGPPPPFVALVGNPRSGSRTAALARAVLAAVVTGLGSENEGADYEGATVGGQVVIDLADLLDAAGSPFGSDAARRYAEHLATVHSARLLIVATPTYKATYTGLLKAFLDHVAAGALRGVVAIPVITVGAPGHTLAADVHLRPLLQELGATSPTAALVVTDADLADPAPVIDTWLAGALPALRALLGAGGAGARVGTARVGTEASEAKRTS
jgi:FMN reductase